MSLVEKKVDGVYIKGSVNVNLVLTQASHEESVWIYGWGVSMTHSQPRRKSCWHNSVK